MYKENVKYIKEKNINIVEFIKKKDILMYEKENNLVVSDLNDEDYMKFVEHMKNKKKLLMRC